MLKRVRRPATRLLTRVYGAATSPEKWLYRAGLRSPGDLTLPEFVCIGAQKAGTTWLCENLRMHPEVFIPRPQSTHYFDREFHQPLKFYSSKFRDGASKVKGESCPAYAVMARSRIRAMRSLMPDVRIILMIRNPIERAWSHALMGLVQRSGAQFEEIPESAFLKHFVSERSRSRSDYMAILDTWLETFPADQLFVGIFDDIVVRPPHLLREVFRHLRISEDVDYAAFPYRQVINRGVGIAIPDVHRRALTQIYSKEIERLHRRLGDSVAAWRCS